MEIHAEVVPHPGWWSTLPDLRPGLPVEVPLAGTGIWPVDRPLLLRGRDGLPVALVHLQEVKTGAHGSQARGVVCRLYTAPEQRALRALLDPFPGTRPATLDS